MGCQNSNKVVRPCSSLRPDWHFIVILTFYEIVEAWLLQFHYTSIVSVCALQNQNIIEEKEREASKDSFTQEQKQSNTE